MASAAFTEGMRSTEAASMVDMHSMGATAGMVAASTAVMLGMVAGMVGMAVMLGAVAMDIAGMAMSRTLAGAGLLPPTITVMPAIVVGFTERL